MADLFIFHKSKDYKIISYFANICFEIIIPFTYPFFNVGVNMIVQREKIFSMQLINRHQTYKKFKKEINNRFIKEITNFIH